MTCSMNVHYVSSSYYCNFQGLCYKRNKAGVMLTVTQLTLFPFSL